MVDLAGLSPAPLGVRVSPRAPNHARVGSLGTADLGGSNPSPLGVQVPPRAPNERVGLLGTVDHAVSDTVLLGVRVPPCSPTQARSSEAERPFYTGRVGISKFPAPTTTAPLTKDAPQDCAVLTGTVQTAVGVTAATATNSRVVSSAGERRHDTADVRCSTHRRRTNYGPVAQR